MIELDYRAERFLDSIRQEGEQSCATLRKQTDEQINAALKKTRAEEKRKAAHTLAFENERNTAAANCTLSKEREKARATLSAQRQELANAAFLQAEKHLEKFAAGKDYPEWLQKSATELCGTLGKEATLYARTADMPLVKKLVKDAGLTVNLQPDDTIRLGGLKGVNAELAVDDTLESRLSEQKEWFLQHAGMNIAL